MDKISKFFPLALFCIYFFRTVIKGAELVDAPIFLILATLIIASEVIIKNKQLEVVKKDLSDTKLLLKEQANQIEEVKNNVSAMKIGTMQRLTQTGR